MLNELIHFFIMQSQATLFLNHVHVHIVCRFRIFECGKLNLSANKAEDTNLRINFMDSFFVKAVGQMYQMMKSPEPF